MDQKLFLLINRDWTGPALDRFMAICSSFSLWAPIFFGAALLLAWRGGFRARAFLVVTALTIPLADGAIANPLKHFTDRPRPADALPGVRLVDLSVGKLSLFAALTKPRIRTSTLPATPGPGRSFPSSHTSNTMAVAVLAALFFPRRGWLAILAALAVGYSRIYVGAHWPSDVTASWFLGAGLGLLAYLAAGGIWRWWSPRLWPAVADRHAQWPE